VHPDSPVDSKSGTAHSVSIELAFWHPSSAMPEYGLCRFSTKDKAQALIDFLTSSSCAEPLDSKDLTIEPYDLTEHERLTTEYPLPSAWEQPI
jgi:hypothetical protein